MRLEIKLILESKHFTRWEDQSVNAWRKKMQWNCEAFRSIFITAGMTQNICGRDLTKCSREQKLCRCWFWMNLMSTGPLQRFHTYIRISRPKCCCFNIFTLLLTGFIDVDQTFRNISDLSARLTSAAAFIIISNCTLVYLNTLLLEVYFRV